MMKTIFQIYKGEVTARADDFASTNLTVMQTTLARVTKFPKYINLDEEERSGLFSKIETT